MVPLDQARREMGPDQVLAGNIDPVQVLRDGTPESSTRRSPSATARPARGTSSAAGCEVPRDTPEANVLALRDFARGH